MSVEIIEIQENQNKRLIKNAIFSSLSWFLPIVLTILATPIIVKGLGVEQYGLYALILGFISYSFTLGIGRTVTKYVAEYKSLGKTEKISEIISATFWFTIGLCVIGCSILAISSDFIVRTVLQIEQKNHDAAINGFYIACASIFFLMTGQIFQSVLQAIHRFDSLSILITLNGFLLTIGNIVLVLIGFGFNALLFWSLAVGTINCLLFYIFAKKYLPEFRLIFSVEKDTLGLVLKYSIGVIGYQIFANVLLIFERSWITRKLGAESLTYYVVPMTLALYLHAFISSIAVVVFPVMSELQNDPEKLLRIYQRATKVIFTIVAFAVLTMICSGKLFLSLWINTEFGNNSAAILTIHSLSFGVFSILVVIWQLAEGFGRPRFNTLISLIWVTVSIPLMIFLIKYSENTGVATARLIGNLLTIPFILLGERLFLGKIYWGFWGKLVLVLGIAVTVSGLAEIWFFHYFPQNWLTLIFGGFIGFCIFAAFVWFLQFYTVEEKAFLKGILMRKRV